MVIESGRSGRSHPGERPRSVLAWIWRSRARRSVLLFFLALLLATAARGPDFSRYFDWAVGFEVQHLGDMETFTLSPLGVPVSQWSHGTGLLYAVAHLVLGFLGDLELSALLAGWGAAAVTALLMLQTLWIASGRRGGLVVLGIGVLLLGTPVGYYLRVHASESIGMLGVAIFVWLFWAVRRPGLVSFFLLGSAVALCFFSKSYLAVYAAPVLAALLWRMRREPWRRWGLAAIVMALPVLVAAVQVGFVNRWMTGSMLQSPYQFGGPGFQSLDFANPQLRAVLLHPWHGLLAYHPLYGIATGCAVALIFLTRSRRLRWYALLSLGAIALHVWVQASYAIWWLGRATFGMRGMVAAALVSVPLMVRWLRLSGATGSRAADRVTVAAVVCCGWSIPLLFDGPSNVYTWSALLSDQIYLLQYLLWSRGPWIFFGLWGLFALIRRAETSPEAPAGWLHGRRVGSLREIATGSLLAVYATYLILELVKGNVTRPVELLGGGVVVVGALWTSGCVAGAAWATGRSPGPHRAIAAGSRARAQAWGAVTLAAVLGLSTALFVPFAVSIETGIREGRRAPGRYAYRNTFNVRDLRLAYREYNRVPGFEKEKQAMALFLLSQGVPPEALRSRPAGASPRGGLDRPDEPTDLPDGTESLRFTCTPLHTRFTCCDRCHGGPLLTATRSTTREWPGSTESWRTPDEHGSWGARKTGGAFKTPALREVSRTAPYMHDGNLATLEEVVEFYDEGGRPNPALDPLIRPLGLSARDKGARVAFLGALSGTILEGVGRTHLP